MADVLATTPPPGIRTGGKRQVHAHLVQPGAGYVGAAEALGTWLGAPGFHLMDLASLPAGDVGQKLVALRFILANLATWTTRFAWRPSLAGALVRAWTNGMPAADRVDAALERVDSLVATANQVLAGPIPDADSLVAALDALPDWARRVDQAPPELLVFLMGVDVSPATQQACAQALRQRAGVWWQNRRQDLDLAYLCTYPLQNHPATSVSAGSLDYVVVADKGEMGTRAVRECLALKKTPVVVFSQQDDAGALQVRLCGRKKGLTVGLQGNFRQSYAGYEQMAARVKETLRAAFPKDWAERLQRAALYPGYGPLAENAAAIRHFRREGLAFVGPMQDVVERAGDKRKFRALAQSLDPAAVTPGVVLDSVDEQVLLEQISRAHAQGAFSFPGRLKAANGGGGRGQAVVQNADGLPAAVNKVLGEIRTNGWDAGVMFEQNIANTVHLEVQVLRDRYGNARHFGMRDCTEQRASQKIQEEAPPALLMDKPDVATRICNLAVQIADMVGYVGAGTVELMWKDDRFYFLEMNTRIQVEHPVTEESHAIRLPNGKLEPLNLVRLQLRIAEGWPLDFAQEQVEQTHVAREFRINAESWNPQLRDARDGGRGLFVPNGGVFDVIDVPDRKALLKSLANDVSDLKVRFDCGFEPGDVLVNKDPTFGKLIVAVRPAPGVPPHEALRRASMAVLKRMRITGRQVTPDGRVLEDQPFLTNVPAHMVLLGHPVLVKHASAAGGPQRHVNWVVEALRSAKPA